MGEQDTGVVLEDPVLVAQDGMNQAAHGLRRRMAGGSFASEEVDQSGFAEEVPGFVAGLWVPETVHTALDLLLRRQPATGMIRRWRYS